jgi:iron complex outermembrane receptor protein
LVLALAWTWSATLTAAAQTSIGVQDLGQLSIEELANLPVTSVSRAPEPLNRAPASIFVITADDIRRSGVHTVAEALRLAPNLDVIQLNAVDYAISARGFNGTPAIANKLLVLIDGRSVYSTLFAGVFWDAQGLLLADIDRIEVISGPGGTLWGANAVNGVINIITKSSAQTQGVLAEVGGGNLDQQVNLRVGGALGEHGTFRVYGMGYKRGHSAGLAGSPSDEWDGLQAGFRFDWGGSSDTIALQGDLYNNSVETGAHNRGQNIVGRWTHRFSESSALQVQAYYDSVPRSGPGAEYQTETYDIEIQHNISLGSHSVVWGAGYRNVDDSFEVTGPAAPFLLNPSSRTVTLANLFAMDTVQLSDMFSISAGIKLEESSYTGFAASPEARLAWQISPENFIWASVARAVRTPSRIDRDIQIGSVVLGGPNFDTEAVTAAELGYKGQFFTNVLMSATLFHNWYADLRTVEFTDGGLPIVIANGAEGTNYGVEFFGSYDVQPWWRLSAGMTALWENFEVIPGHVDLTNLETPGNNPEVHGSLRSQFDLSNSFSLDVRLRGVSARPSPSVSGFFEADVSVLWRVTNRLNLQLTGRNLLHDSHVEGISGPTAFGVRRSVFLTARWTM